MSRTRTPLKASLGTLALVALAACGTSQPSQDQQDDARDDEAAAAGTDADVNTGPITLTDADGRTVELPGPAQSVVSLEWQMTEMVLTLGVDLVGAADPVGYETWDSAEPLPDGVADVGLCGEASPDAIYQAEPDLIVIEQGGPELKSLEKQDVPVLVVAGADAADPVAQMRETFELIATATGTEDVAADVLAEFDATLADATDAVAQAAPETTEFAYADAYVVGSTVSIRPFGQGSLVGELGEAIGLTNVWAGEVDDVYGLGQTDVEGLAAIGDVSFFYTGTESDQWLGELEGNAVWSNAPFVEKGNVEPFPTSTWTFGGPRSGEQIVEAFVDGVTS